MVTAPTTAMAIAAEETGRERIMLVVISLMPRRAVARRGLTAYLRPYNDGNTAMVWGR